MDTAGSSLDEANEDESMLQNCPLKSNSGQFEIKNCSSKLLHDDRLNYLDR